jgi:phosphoglucosamine mutase
VAELGAYVREQNAVLGMALDGDADRVLLVDETGVERDGDHLLGLFARDLLARGLLTGDRLVTTVMANLGLKVFLEGLGVVCDMVPVGDRFVSAEMAETGAVVGGEQSGHIIFRDRATTGDGILTGIELMRAVRAAGMPLSELAGRIPRLPQVVINSAVRRRHDWQDDPEFTAAVERATGVMGDRGRILVRPSGTEPKIRIMVEGDDAAEIERIARELATLAEARLN